MVVVFMLLLIIIIMIQFKITNTKLCVTTITFSTKGDGKLKKQLNKGFIRSVY